jgi:hypothetical protein
MKILSLRFSFTTAKARRLAPLMLLGLSGLSGCALLKPAPMNPPSTALLQLTHPVIAQVLLVDDAGNSVNTTVLIPKGWCVMNMGRDPWHPAKEAK